MVQLGNRNQDSTGLAALIVSLCMLCGMVFALLGIKLHLFKHRLNINENDTQHGSRSGSYELHDRISENDSKHRVIPEGTEVYGFYRSFQEGERDVKRPVVKPPIREPNLKLETRTSLTKEKLPCIPGKIAPFPRLKELRSIIFEIPLTQDNQKQQLEDTEFAAKLEEFGTQFEEVEKSNDHKETNSPPSTTSVAAFVTETKRSQIEVPCRLTKVDPMTVNENPGTSFTAQRNFEGILPIEPNNFQYSKEADAAIEEAIVKLREATVNSANGQGNRNSFLTIEPDKLKYSDEVDDWLRETSVNLGDGRGKRNSYVKYEEVDKIDEGMGWDTLTLNNLNLDHRFEESAHGFNYKSPSLMSVFEPPNTVDLFENLEHTNVERTVEHLWLKIEQHNSDNAQAHDIEFRQNRHSTELYEADILADSSLEFTELKEVKTTPTGYGKSIDEDWENFENLSVMASAEQIFEPRIEQIDTTLSDEEEERRTTNLEIDNLNAIFGELEIPDNPYTWDIEEEGATALVINEIHYQATNVNLVDTKLPDYDSLMENDNSNYLLPDYEDVMKNNPTPLKKEQFVNSIEDLYNEMLKNEDAAMQEVKDMETKNDNVAYITNIDEIYHDLGLEYTAPQFPTESFLDEMAEKLLCSEVMQQQQQPTSTNSVRNIATQDLLNSKGMQQTIPTNLIQTIDEGDTTSTINLRPSIMRNPAKRRTLQTKRLKVQFGIDKTQYYQPAELVDPFSSDEEEEYFKKNIPKPRKHFMISNASYEFPSTSANLQPPKIFGTQDNSENNSDDSHEEEWLASGQERSSKFILQQIRKLNRSVVDTPMQFVRPKKFERNPPSTGSED